VFVPRRSNRSGCEGGPGAPLTQICVTHPGLPLSNGDQASPRRVSPHRLVPPGPITHFEAPVGASHILAVLTGAEPRGLPGTIIDRVELQRAGEGRPLDDVIVHAHDASGVGATLEIQVKREITIPPSDEVFRDVVRQIAAAANRARLLE
jgi:hypothetical protein